MDYEAAGEYQRAKKTYKDDLLRKGKGLPETEEEKYFEESYLRSLKRLGEWDIIQDHLKERNVRKICQDPWQRENVLQLYVKSNFHRMVEKSDTGFELAIAEAKNDPVALKVLESTCGLEMALSYVQKDVKRAQFYNEVLADRLVRYIHKSIIILGLLLLRHDFLPMILYCWQTWFSSLPVLFCMANKVT